MSSKPLTKPQIDLLKLGLKFTPTPKANHTELETDVKTFCRKLRPNERFYKDDDTDNSDTEDSDEENDTLVRNKSNYNPNPNRNIMLDNCISTLSKVASQQPETHQQKSNLTKQQQKALKELQGNEQIIIKKADKGGAICIMDKSFYVEKITEMLNDDSTYKQLETDEFNSIIKNLNKLTDKHSHCLKPEEIDYVTNFEMKESNLYGLPKIHKSQIIKNAITQQNSDYISIPNPSDLKFRPIVAGPVCPTSRLSHLIDILLKELPSQTNSYVRDDIDFLSKINRNLNPAHDNTLITYDVESLYTNIDHDLGIKAITFWLRKHPHLINQRFSEEFICDSIKFILDNNTFTFNNQHFIQTKGTAMGTKMAPTYANLVLAYLEEILYNKINSDKGEEYSDFIKRNFLRYIDDCFVIWPENKYDINFFTKELNSMHPNFKFVKENSKTHIAFLDIKILITNNKLTTDIHYKPTDSHQFLPFNSCHPKHTKTSIPYSQARRICTIVEDPQQLHIRLEEMKHFFLSRGYPQKLIEDSIAKALSIPQHILRQTKHKQSTDVLPFVHTHNPNNPNLTHIVRSTLETLKHDKRMKEVLAKTKFIPSKRQAPNLGKLLTRAKLTNTQTNNGSFKCQDKKCKNCKHMNQTQTLFIKSTGKTFTIKHHLTCKTQNVLYAITCTGCHEQYIGMTNNTLAKRFNLHRHHIKHPCYRKLGVSKHIAECSSQDIKFTVTPFFKITNDKTQGLTKEAFFIKQFQPTLNKLTL